MYKKFFIAISLLTIMIANTVSAEQPAANEYRKIFHSGNFYVEFKDNYTTRALSEANGKRMERTIYNGIELAVAFNPLASLFGGGVPKNPDSMYEDGKYYQFLEKNEALVISKDQMDDENLDPRQGWNGIRQKLSLPMELAVFYWDDPYNDKSNALNRPKFFESGKKNVGKKNCDYDRYISTIKSTSSNEETKLVYDAIYEAGKLIEIQSYILKGDKEYPVNVLKVKRIEGEIPKDAFKIEKNTKIYAAGIGDMNDLLEDPVQVGVMRESKK